MIDLHYSATPNGQKIAIMLEEIGASWRVIPSDIFDGDQLSEGFGRINPNPKLPAIVDQYPSGGCTPIAVSLRRAQCRERGGQYVSIPVHAVSFKTTLDPTILK